jgi:hypothetical protein
MKKNSVFIVTSTVATDYGTGDRLAETLQTIESIRNRVDARIILIDSSVLPWDEKPVREAVDTFLRVNDGYVQNIINTNYGLPFIKSATEVYLTQIALDLMGGTDSRVYKLSGRYRLTDEFVEHDGQNFVFLQPKPTGIAHDMCDAKGMLMTRLYSLPGDFRTFYANVLVQVNSYLWRIYSQQGLTDIEHGLYKFLPHNLCKFVPTIGVEGRIGHLNTEVRE